MALRGVSGSLASAALLETLTTVAAAPRLAAVLSGAVTRLGPASSARQVADFLVFPLLQQTDLAGELLDDASTGVSVLASADDTPVAIFAAAAWNADLRRLRQTAARAECAVRPRWWVGTNGAILRIVDVSRAYAQRAIDLDIGCMAAESRGAALLERLLETEAGRLARLEDLVARSDQYRSSASRSLRSGVDRALVLLLRGFTQCRRRPVALDAALADALTVVYRLLFLLFAEARGLVPQWHPIYRDSYTIESLRPQAEGGRPEAGLWQALQAIARLAHRGCTAGTLRVVPFNGRLFAPAAAPLAESLPLDDRLVRDVLLAVTTQPGADRRERISYGDLGVEQLGAVYESVLDYEPSTESGRIALTPSGKRKSTGTFYTPRSITEFLVRRTLAPLVLGRTPAAILSLRVLDPAMGSGAFLVAACRYLADAYEESLILDGTVTRADIAPADRASFRRAVAQRCLYGVDRNPIAVQLARLSLWLCTLAADRPLTFLDHHLRCGNSLAGAGTADLARQPPGSGRRRPHAALPLFELPDLPDLLASTVVTRLEIARQSDDTAAIVHGKERAIEGLHGARAPLAPWRALADAWCAAWFWPAGTPRLDARTWPAFSDSIRGADHGLPRGLADQWRAAAAAVAARERFFHWEFEFPEAFFDERGTPADSPGFDAVLGNPPWTAAKTLTAFSRESGCYRLQGDGHANLYQLFAERMARLAAPGGRIGMLMPSGLLSDTGSGRLREHLFDRCAVDSLIGFDNRDAIFPIHRSMRFTLLTATNGGSTSELASRAALRSPLDLDDIPDRGSIPGAISVPLTLVRRFSGAGMAVPELRAERDRAILARVLASVPLLSDDDGWGAHFGRELNATDDREHFGARGLPVIEGKLVDPFRVRLEETKRFVEPATARRLIGSRIDRPRLGYREVASATNRLTLIAAVIPARVVTTHTVFTLREPLDDDAQRFLCGIFNSFVANYLVRLRAGTHVPASVIHRLPVPMPSRESRIFETLAALAGAIARGALAPDVRTELQVMAARAYSLDPGDLRHILDTFPLVPIEERAAVLTAFEGRKDGL
ncbi:MAG TPA: N-6 DNA methylase [Vicinamibacterales bacterium]|nr:N-6 DNA methylase [Vicinamibacterales bacterium]